MQLINAWLQYLQDHSLDYTLSFRRLSAHLEAANEGEFCEFEARWKQRIAGQPESTAELKRQMEVVNPLFIPRNHQVERAIQGAIASDLSVFHDLNRVLRQPFVEQPEFAHYAQPPKPDERVERTFCGT